VRQIGILGGTFDPPHLGHLLIAEQVKEALSLDEVWFIPTNEPPHKTNAMTPSKHRVIMLQKAIQGNDDFHIKTIELERAGKSYTIDTIKQLKRRYENVQFHFIIGADMVNYLDRWYQIDELIKHVQFVGVERPGYVCETSHPVTIVDIPLIDISSTDIRRRLKTNASIRYLTPSSVQQYIKEMNLYDT